MINLGILWQRLSDFGLNPNDWVMEIKTQMDKMALVEVRSRHESTVLEGWALNEIWLDLRLSES